MMVLQNEMTRETTPNFAFPVAVTREANNYAEHAFSYLQEQRQNNINEIFWSRIGEKPAVQGAKVLELGCGLGNLSIDMALAGASSVVGVDLNDRDIEVANINLQRNFPDLCSKVEFLSMALQDYSSGEFDFIISKDTFEHVLDLEMILSQFERLLKPGGKAYVGFGPLWHSPFGFHGNAYGWNFGNKYPWAHLHVSESEFVKQWNQSVETKIASFADLGLNKVSVKEYRHIFNTCDLTLEAFQVNRSNDFKSKIFWLLHFLPVIGKYFSHNLYCILAKDEA